MSTDIRIVYNSSAFQMLENVLQQNPLKTILTDGPEVKTKKLMTMKGDKGKWMILNRA